MQTYTTSKSKENILRKIRTALRAESISQPYPSVSSRYGKNVFTPLSMPSLEETFALEFKKSGGLFSFCSDYEELAENLNYLAKQRGWEEVMCANRTLLPILIEKKLPFIREYHIQNDAASVCITDCELAIARTGSIMFSSRQNFGRSASIYFPVHIVILKPEQVLPDIADSLSFLKNKYNDHLPSMINLNTGPSRTADIEKVLLKGVHGPKEVFCFMVNV